MEVAARNAIGEAYDLQDDRLLSMTVEELVEDIMSRHDMETPVLNLDAREVTDSGSGKGVELHVPFTGTRGLFENQPNFYTSYWPDGKIVGSEVVVGLGQADDGAAARADGWAAQVKEYLTHVRHDLEIWQRETRSALNGVITKRLGEAQRHQEGLRTIGIPIRRRGDAPRTYTEPAIVRRQSTATASAAAVSPSEPEPMLSDEYYEHILFVIRAAGKVMERSPETYEGWGEEDRRQMLLLMLNTHYAGKVYAEAFNSKGKTDILIREEDRNVFIGECKFYGGPESVTKTMNQIFGYATWRDVKLAIVFFVDRESFTTAFERIKTTVGESEPFRFWSRMPSDQETEFRALMAWPGDDRRSVTSCLGVQHAATCAGG
jgi:hypothetical protein